MARGYWRVQRYQVFYGENGESMYASTEKQAEKLAKKHNGYAIECDGGRQIYPTMPIMLQNGFVQNEHFHIISARKAFDTQHIALAWSDDPMCGTKITQVNEVSLLLGYLCEHCKKRLERLATLADTLSNHE